MCGDFRETERHTGGGAQQSMSKPFLGVPVQGLEARKFAR